MSVIYLANKDYYS